MESKEKQFKIKVTCAFTVTAETKDEAEFLALNNADYNGADRVILDEVYIPKRRKKS